MVGKQHTFVVPAYGQSPHLADCLKSLRVQAIDSRVVIATSTPGAWLQDLAHRFDARLAVREGPPGIGRDWNFALAQADTPWVTLAHQDDLYLPDYVRRVMAAASRHPGAALVFTGYRELADGHARRASLMLGVKRSLLEVGFLGREVAPTPASRLRALRFGCPIPCPSVALNLPACGALKFSEELRVNLDWAAWLGLARQKAPFAYVRTPLMLHRIHRISETSNAIRQGVRAREDLEMFEALWPRPVARVLARAYTLSYESGETQ